MVASTNVQDEQPDDDGTPHPEIPGGYEGGLSPDQERAILALLNEPTIPKAAVAAGVGERTLRRWIAENPKFRGTWYSARRDGFSHAIGLLQHYAPGAAQTLAKIMTDPQAPHSARVSAATNVFKCAREGIELDELVMRIEALEKAQDNANQGGRCRAS
jgi:hypothetical protein